MKLYRGTDSMEAASMLDGNIKRVSWWSNDYETIEHYFEGSVLEIEINLEDEPAEYIRDKKDIYDGYTYGFIELNYPPEAIWYSISDEYIIKNMRTLREISLEEASILL